MKKLPRRRSLFALRLTLGLLASTPIYAAQTPTCGPGTPEVRLDRKGGPLENAPVVDQGMIPGCYSTTLALLVQAALPKHPQVSFLDAFGSFWQWTLKQDPNAKTLGYPDGGMTCGVFRAVAKQGFCITDRDDFERLTPKYAANILDKFAQYFQAYQFQLTADDRRNWNTFVNANRDYFVNASRLQPTLLGMGSLMNSAYSRLEDEASDANPERFKSQKERVQSYFTNTYYDTVEELKKASATPAVILARVKSDLKKLGASPAIVDDTFGGPIKFLLPGLEYEIEHAPELKRLHQETLAMMQKCPECFQRGTKKRLMYSHLTELTQRHWELPPSLRDKQMQHTLNVITSDAETPDGAALALKAVIPDCRDASKRARVSSDLSCKYPADFAHMSGNQDLNKMVDIFKTEVLGRIAKDQPVGINYCKNVLIDPSFDSKYMQKCVALDNFEALGTHGSVIIGYRGGKESCEYLLQNSFGTNCDKYNHLPRGSCEGGKLWLKERDLVRNTYALSTLDLVPGSGATTITAPSPDSATKAKPAR